MTQENYTKHKRLVLEFNTRVAPNVLNEPGGALPLNHWGVPERQRLNRSEYLNSSGGTLSSVDALLQKSMHEWRPMFQTEHEGVSLTLSLSLSPHHQGDL